MKHVMIAGATGYLGRFLCAEYGSRGYHVTALVRASARTIDLAADAIITAEATDADTLAGCMDGIDLVISALGITRQTDGVGYWDVDYRANLNLLEEAERSGVAQFAFVHVLNAEKMADVPLVAAKSAFVERLRASPLRSTVIAPTGYFSDMGDFLAMARSGRVWLFGSGEKRINPIHGADLAAAIFEAVAAGVTQADIGGPEVFSQNDLARLCFDALGTRPRILHLPEMLRRLILFSLRLFPRRIAGPARFFLTAGALDMTAPRSGHRELGHHFAALISDGVGPAPSKETPHAVS